MDSFKSINDLIQAVNNGSISSTLDLSVCRRILSDNPKALSILQKIEDIGYWKQEYFLYRNALLSTYFYEERILGPVRFKTRVFGFPGMDKPGCLLAKGSSPGEDEMPEILAAAADSLSGTSAVMDINRKIYKSPPFKGNMVFINRFASFEEYMAALRSKYRRDRNLNLKKASRLRFARLEEGGFTQSHYDLYLSVYRRAEEKLDLMPFEYFRTFEMEIFEIRDLAGRLLAFFHLREMDDELHFLYVGFIKDGEAGIPDHELRSVDIYFDILVFILRHGIEQGFEKIIFGPTTEEAKGKIGCSRESRYVYITSGNPLLRSFFRRFSPFFFKPEEQPGRYNVFKDQDA